MLIFKNPGLIPEAAITTMGVNAKLIDNPIGQFGTGLKYAIAIILRGGGKINIYRGKKALEFGIKAQTIRDKDFKIVTMNGKPLGFTDQVGLNWKPWMAYRELFSNCRDEGGSIQQIVYSGEELGKAKETWIVVEWPELEKIHDNRHQIVLPTEALYTLKGVEVHPGVDGEHIYYKKIRVLDLTPKSRFTYSLIDEWLLTEDRTLLYPSLVPGRIATAIITSTNRAFLRQVLSDEHVKEYWEGKINYQIVQNVVPSVEFLEVADELKATKKLVTGAASLFNHFQDTMPGYVSPYIVSEHSETERSMIDEAVAVVLQKFPDFDRSRMYFKTQQQYRVQVSKGSMILNADLLKRGKMHIARAIVEGIATEHKGGIAEQLTNYILLGSWIPEELVDQWNRAGDNYDSIF